MLIEAKSHLARLMATENLTIEERNVPTAFFDMKSRILTVPILNGNLSPQLYDLLLGHEVGHALETPAEGWHNSVSIEKVEKSILNVCEDVRIEKKIKRKFPGLKPSFIRGYQDLMEMDFFETKGKNLNKLNFIDRVNLHTKGGASLAINFSQEEKVLLSEVESTETWKDVVAVAKKIQEFMKVQNVERQKVKIKIAKGKKEKSEPLTEQEKELLEKLDNGEIDYEIEFEEEEGDQSKGDNVEEGEGDDSSDESGSGEKENDTTSEQSGAGSAGSDDMDESLTSKTDEAFREKEKELFSKDVKRDIIYSNIPTLDYKKLIVTHKQILECLYLENKNDAKYNPQALKAQYKDFKTESNKVVSYLVKEFELRKNAEQQSRAKVSKTGELNMNRIHEYKLTDDIFARMTKIPNGKSHGLVIYIDWSGSMADKIHVTVKQLLNLVMFCKKVNIPFDVYAFTSQWRVPNPQVPKVGDLVVKDFSLLNLFNHKMSVTDYVEMSMHLLDYGTGYRNLSTYLSIPSTLALGGTPLNHSIVSAFSIIPEFKKENKIDIVNAVFLTDGESALLGDRYDFIDVRTNKPTVTSEARPSYRIRSVLRDPKNKASVEISDAGARYGSAASCETMALLKLLKQRAHCNLVGFYIAPSREMRSAFELYTSISSESYHERTSKVDKMMFEFKKEKLFVLEDVGYDEYYFIATSSMETEDDELVITSSTTRGMASEFSKYTGGKVNSRIILNRFIKMIA